MRLTLRTLLAWLDDKLPPVQVREIGKQVAISPLAQELVQRIHRVTRQRRLTVPSRNGNEATDPNLVASYLDNDLNAEQVAEYEKKCLVSDVNLAEAASVHQILSLLGQKVHVPVEAKVRMYGLVKGREAHWTPVAEAPQAEPEPTPQPVAPWVVQPPVRRDWIERFGPLAACLGVLALLCWSAYESLKSDPAGAAAVVAAVPSKTGGAEDGSTPAVDPERVPVPPAPPAADLPEEVIAAVPAEAEVEPEPEVEPAAKADAEKKAAPAVAAVAVPDGSSAVVSRLEGMLLRYDPEQREWVRAHEKDGVRPGERLLVAPECSARLAGPDGVLDVLGDTEVRILGDAADDGPNVELVRGRVLAEPSSEARPLHVTFQGMTVDMGRPADLAVGVESTGRFNYGVARPPAPSLTVHVGPGGELALKTVKGSEKVKGPADVQIDAAGVMTTVKGAESPEWLAGPVSSADSTARRERFLKEFSEDRPVLADVVSATESTDPDVKVEAIAALRGLGDLSLLTPILERPEDPVARRATIAELREELSSGDGAARRAWEQLEADLGGGDRARLGRLLLGYTAEDAAAPGAIEGLVESLSAGEPSRGLRELAIDNLRRVTGRDAPAYDPDKPEQGYAAWRKLLDDGALKPAAGK